MQESMKMKEYIEIGLLCTKAPLFIISILKLFLYYSTTVACNLEF